MTTAQSAVSALAGQQAVVSACLTVAQWALTGFVVLLALAYLFMDERPVPQRPVKEQRR